MDGPASGDGAAGALSNAGRPGRRNAAPDRTWQLDLNLNRLHCNDCGYGICVKVAPARCPMCGGKVWIFRDLPTA